MSMRTNSVFWGVIIFVSCVLNRGAVASTGGRLDLGALWAKDRFVRAMAVTPGHDDRGQLDLLNRAITLTQTMKRAPEEVIAINSLAELEKLREKILRPSTSVELDVQDAFVHHPRHLVVTSDVPDVVARFAEIAAASTNMLDQKMMFPPNGGPNARQVGFLELLLENSPDSDMLVNGLAFAPDAMKLGQIHQFAARLQSVAASIDTSIGALLSGGHFQFANKVLEKATRILIGSYFKHLRTPARMRMVFAILERPEDMSPLSVFKRISRRASPQFLKLFQIFGQEPGFAPELQEVFKTFEDDLPAAATHELAERFEELKHVPGFELRGIELDPLKVGSMAEMHRGSGWFTSEDADREVAIRILAPNVRPNLAVENQVLDAVAIDLMADAEVREQFPTLSNVVKNIKVIALAETDVRRTYEAQKRGAKFYNSTETVKLADGSSLTIDVEVPRAEIVVGQDILIQQWRPGVSVDRFSKQNPVAARAGIETWSRLWLKNALVNGFAHIDPHPGNLAFREDRPGHLTILVYDFGMTTEMDAVLRQKLALFAVASYAEVDLVMAKTLISLGNGDLAAAPRVARAIQVERARIKALGREPQLNEWIRLALANGIYLPDEFESFGRGLLAVSSGLRKAGSSLSAGDLVGQMVKRDPTMLWGFRGLTSLVSTEELVRIGGGSLPKLLNTDAGAAVLKSATDFLTSAGQKAGEQAMTGAQTATKTAKGFWSSFAEKAAAALAEPLARQQQVPWIPKSDPAPTNPPAPSPAHVVRCEVVW